jgi:hypothetical protein
MMKHGDFVMKNKFGGTHWEILISDDGGVKTWLRLPDELSAEIEKGRADGRRMIFMKDEEGRPSRCFLDNHDEALSR